MKQLFGITSAFLLVACQPPAMPAMGSAQGPPASAASGVGAIGRDAAATLSRVIQLVAKQLAVEETRVKLDAAFVADLGADSLDLVEIVLALEDEFGVEMKDEDAERVVTVRAAVDYLMAHPSKSLSERDRP